MERYDGKGELINWVKLEYSNDGLIKYEEDHGQVIEYDDQTMESVGRIREDTYNAKIYEYKGKLLTKEVWIQAGKGYKDYNYSITYEYDKSNRLIKEVHIDEYKGPIITFKPSTAIVDSTFNIDHTRQWMETRSYKSDTVIVARHNEDNSIGSYTVIKLSPTKKPVSILSLDYFERPIEISSMTYDQNDNLIRETNKVIDVSKIDYDKVPGDDIQIVYNEKRLPILRVVRENGKVIFTTEIRYE